MHSPAARIFSPGSSLCGHGQFRDALRLSEFLDPNTCREDLFWRGIYNTIVFVIFQVGGMVLFALITALVLNRKIRGRGFFRSIFFYPVLLSPVVVALIWKWILQRNGILNAVLNALGQESILFLLQRQLGHLLGDLCQHLGADGLLHADPAGRPAGDPRRTL